MFPVYNLGTDCIENTASLTVSWIVAIVYVAVEMCLSSRYYAMDNANMSQYFSKYKNNMLITKFFKNYDANIPIRSFICKTT
jgi:hypothetical protein